MKKASKSEPIVPQNPGQPSQARRELLIGLGALVLFILISLGVLVGLNPGGFRNLLASSIQEPPGEQSIEITLMHTNDTWGYSDPCG